MAAPSARATNHSTTVECRETKKRREGESGRLMEPRGRALAHPAGALLLEYATEGCPIDVGRPWTMAEILTAAERGPHKSVLADEAIKMMHTEVVTKVKEGFTEVVYLDEIIDELGSEEWVHLKISPLAIVPHKSRKYRAMLFLGITCPIT